MNLTPQAQHMVLQLQQYQQQAQTIALQKQQIEAQLMEITSALDELSKLDGSYAFRAIGPVLVKKSKEELLKTLREKKETLELRIKALTKQEEKVKTKVTELSQKVSQLVQSSGPSTIIS